MAGISHFPAALAETREDELAWLADGLEKEPKGEARTMDRE